MKKAIKKVGVIVTMVGLMTASLVGCAKTTKCEVCEETKKCNKYEITFEGESEEGWLCDDCYNDYKGLVDLAGGTIKKK